jgi:hypothetical protein
MSKPQFSGTVLEDDLRELESWIEEVYSLQPRNVTSTPIARTILRRDPRHEPVLRSLTKECLNKTSWGKRFAEGATACRRALERLE